MNKSVKFEIDADKLAEEGKAGFLHDLISLLEGWFGGSAREQENTTEGEMLTKSLDEEQRRALFVVLAPQDAEYTDDLHGDTYTEAEVEKACISFNLHCMKANLFHRVQTENAKIEQSFIVPSEFKLEDGRVIKKGTWLQWWYFPKDNETSEMLWKSVKAGEINGVSVGCAALVENIE